jgi:tetratricopeptide (TPR) repeat protein
MDPHFVMAQREIALVYERQGRYAKALAAIRRAIREEGENPIVLGVMGRILASAGDRKAAKKVIAKLCELQQRVFVPSHLIAVIYAGLAEKDQALDWLWRAYEDHSSTLMWIKVDPWVDNLRSEARFADLVRRLGLE